MYETSPRHPMSTPYEAGGRKQNVCVCIYI